MKTFDDFRDEIMDEEGAGFGSTDFDLIANKAALRYARQVAEQTRKDCLKNARISCKARGVILVKKISTNDLTCEVEPDSILNTEIVLP